MFVSDIGPQNGTSNNCAPRFARASLSYNIKINGRSRSICCEIIVGNMRKQDSIFVTMAQQRNTANELWLDFRQKLI